MSVGYLDGALGKDESTYIRGYCDEPSTLHPIMRISKILMKDKFLVLSSVLRTQIRPPVGRMIIQSYDTDIPHAEKQKVSSEGNRIGSEANETR